MFKYTTLDEKQFILKLAISTKLKSEAFMNLEQHESETLTPSVGAQLFMLFGFVIFITGVFSVAYSVLASLLLPLRIEFLMVAMMGLLAAYVGRKMLRKGRRLAEVSFI